MNIVCYAYLDDIKKEKLNIHSLAAMIGIAVNEPKKFPKFRQFYKDPRDAKKEEKEMKRQAGIIGARLPS